MTLDIALGIFAVTRPSWSGREPLSPPAIGRAIGLMHRGFATITKTPVTTGRLGKG